MSDLKTNGWTVVDNFLEEDFFKEIIKFTNSYEDDWIDSSTFFPEHMLVDDKVEVEGNLKVTKNNHWNDFKSDGIIGRYQNKIIDYLKESIDLNLEDISSNFRTRIYQYDEKSSLYWHTDKRYLNSQNKQNTNFGYACTLYLNEKWEENWGGETLLGDGRWIRPKRNRLFIVNTNLKHKVSMIAKGANIRMSLQSFFTTKKACF